MTRFRGLTAAFAALCLFAVLIASARPVEAQTAATYQLTDSANVVHQTHGFQCISTLLCLAYVPIDFTGSPFGVSNNPFFVSPAPGTNFGTSTPFTPSGLFGSLTATASASASTALPTNTGTVEFSNLTSAYISCVLASGSATGVVNAIILPPMSVKDIGVAGMNNVSCIDQTGSSGSNQVLMAGGSGNGSGFGGGASGGGGSGLSVAYGGAIGANGTPSGFKDGSGNFQSLLGDVTNGQWVLIKNSSLPVTGTFWPYTLGQQVAGSSVPVVLTAAQLATLTPPAAITNYSQESGGNLAQIVTDIGAPGATACTTDSASCSVNQFLQRIAQRITSLITALGTPMQQTGGTVTSNQGTANTEPWLTSMPNANTAALATWTSGTSGGTNVDIPNSGLVPNTQVTLTQGALSAGVVTFRAKDAAGNYVNLPSNQVVNCQTLATIPNPYTLQSGVTQSFCLQHQGYTSANVDLTTQITGAGSVVVSTQLVPYRITDPALLNPIIWPLSAPPVTQTDGTNTALVDPCQSGTKVFTPINVATSTNVIIAGVSAKKKYLCHILLYPGATVNFAVFQATTGTSCATSATDIFGGHTTTTGFLATATAGFAAGNGASSIAATTTVDTDICIANGGSVQLSGVAVTVDR